MQRRRRAFSSLLLPSACRIKRRRIERNVVETHSSREARDIQKVDTTPSSPGLRRTLSQDEAAQPAVEPTHACEACPSETSTPCHSLILSAPRSQDSRKSGAPVSAGSAELHSTLLSDGEAANSVSDSDKRNSATKRKSPDKPGDLLAYWTANPHASCSLQGKHAQRSKHRLQQKRPNVTIQLGSISGAAASSPCHRCWSSDCVDSTDSGHASQRRMDCSRAMPFTHVPVAPVQHQGSGEESTQRSRPAVLREKPRSQVAKRRGNVERPQAAACIPEDIPRSVQVDRNMINTMNVSRRTSSRWSEFARDGAPWKADEEEWLLRHFSLGCSLDTLSLLLSRTRSAVKARIKLRRTEPSPQHTSAPNSGTLEPGSVLELPVEAVEAPEVLLAGRLQAAHVAIGGAGAVWESCHTSQGPTSVFDGLTPDITSASEVEDVPGEVCVASVGPVLCSDVQQQRCPFIRTPSCKLVF